MNIIITSLFPWPSWSVPKLDSLPDTNCSVPCSVLPIQKVIRLSVSRTGSNQKHPLRQKPLTSFFDFLMLFLHLSFCLFLPAWRLPGVEIPPCPQHPSRNTRASSLWDRSFRKYDASKSCLKCSLKDDQDNAQGSLKST